MSFIITSFLVLDFKKPTETELCLKNIKENALFPHKTIYLDNGSNDEYPYEFYKNGLCDVFISKKNGMGGGYGQTDLWRYCDTEYAYFIQNDQILKTTITKEDNNYFVSLLNNGYQCIDLNGNQGHGKWSDRAHMMKTSIFNSLAPFPNGGPGDDNTPWNEKHLQDKFSELNYKIAHLAPAPFSDNGKYSFRQAGGGILIHSTDEKQMWVLEPMKYKSEVYPPLNELEYIDMLNGKWPLWGIDKVGRVPEAWKNSVFKCW